MSDEERISQVSRMLQENHTKPIDLKTLRATVRLLNKIEASRVDGVVPVAQEESVGQVLENLKAITESLERIDWVFGAARRHVYSENHNARYKI
jgi:hypothetical protein